MGEKPTGNRRGKTTTSTFSSSGQHSPLVPSRDQKWHPAGSPIAQAFHRCSSCRRSHSAKSLSGSQSGLALSSELMALWWFSQTLVFTKVWLKKVCRCRACACESPRGGTLMKPAAEAESPRESVGLLEEGMQPSPPLLWIHEDSGKKSRCQIISRC